MQTENVSEEQKGNDANRVLSAVVFPQILEKWDTAIVDLNRNGGMFKFDNVRLRNCSLHFSETTGEYYVRYRDVTFGGFDVYNCR
jgi:hypothetical protein